MHIQKDILDGYGNESMKQGTVKKAILMLNKADPVIFIQGVVLIQTSSESTQIYCSIIHSLKPPVREGCVPAIIKDRVSYRALYCAG
jgi:hypothetical protein